MLQKIKNGADAAIDVGIKLISLSIVLQVIFGQKVAFLTGDVIGSILNIVWTLGNAGLAGIIAAGGLFALQNNVERLTIDHEHAKQLEKALNTSSVIKCVIPVETNIVVFELNDHKRTNEYIQTLEKQGVLALTFGKGMIRMVTHLDLDQSAIQKTCECIQAIV